MEEKIKRIPFVQIRSDRSPLLLVFHMEYPASHLSNVNHKVGEISLKFRYVQYEVIIHHRCRWMKLKRKGNGEGTASVWGFQ